jgi:hypothetical protein
MRDRNRDEERKRFELAKLQLRLAAYEAAREAGLVEPAEQKKPRKNRPLRPQLRYKFKLPPKPRPLEIKIPRGADPYLTLKGLAFHLGISIAEARKRVFAGLLPWPIKDGRDSKHRRWLLREVATLLAWERSHAKLSKRKFPALTALQAQQRYGCEGVVIPLAARQKQ